MKKRNKMCWKIIRVAKEVFSLFFLAAILFVLRLAANANVRWKQIRFLFSKFCSLFLLSLMFYASTFEFFLLHMNNRGTSFPQTHIPRTNIPWANISRMVALNFIYHEFVNSLNLRNILINFRTLNLGLKFCVLIKIISFCVVYYSNFNLIEEKFLP